MKIARILLVGTATFGIAVFSILAPQTSDACPFCSAPSLTLSEQLDQADAAVLVEWVSGKEPTEKTPGETTYKISEVILGGKQGLKKEEKVTLYRYRVAKKGDLFVLLGTQGKVIEWGAPLEVTKTSYKYMVEAPKPGTETVKRLAYYLNFFEHKDSMIANDAYAEFANAPYEDITKLSKQMPRKKIRDWLISKDTSVTRIGLYGLLMGLCGNDEDANLMAKKINAPTGDFRLGIDGVMSGYLLLTGAKGLDVIDETKLKNLYVVDSKGEFVLGKDGEKQPVPFSETYAAMQALRFMWTYGNERIPKDRLRQSMRILLDRSELADLVVADLARWKDWTVQDRLMELYDAEEFNIPSIKRAIVRYMLVCSKDFPSGDAVEVPEHAKKATKHLATLKKKDPKTVREAERFFLINRR